MRALDGILRESSARHTHLCPRQVLGARMSLYAGKLLALDLPRRDKRLLVIAETDGCFTDGVEAATGCRVGHRTLRIEDYGKIAATFADVSTGTALRVAPRLDIRRRAFAFAPGERRRYFAQLHAYQVMPDDELFSMDAVQLKTPLAEILSRPGVRVNCDGCGEEIINGREVRGHELVLCLPCAGSAYYSVAAQSSLVESALTGIFSRQIETAI
jgi:formylmethanofuran dehydrogenase subunit E